MRQRNISALEAELGYHFRDPELLEQALTHSSHARELEAQAGENGGPTQVGDNEQLEFLGDAVLGFVTSQELFERFPDYREGQLSKLRAHLVSEKHLIRAANELKLGRFLRLGRGEEKSGGREKTTLLVDALEALLAALYLDAGLEAARALILEHIVNPELGRLKRQSSDGLPVMDFKSTLQETVHSSGRSQPAYVLVKEKGPEHSKTFTVEARVYSPGEHGRAEFVGRGEGSTKKKAEQNAAKQVLDYLQSAGQEDAVKPLRKSRSVTRK